MKKLLLFCAFLLPFATILQAQAPYCLSVYNGCYGVHGINLFQLNTINQSVSCTGSPPYYHDFTGVSTALSVGTPYTITVQAGYANTWVSVWIDYNQNYVFENSELVGQVICVNANTNYSIVPFTVPGTALSGNTRLRVKTEYAGYPIDACHQENVGNYCDFTVNIPAQAPIPTLSQWGLIIFGILLLSVGTLFIYRRRLNAIRV